jgi:hypothetical protein
MTTDLLKITVIALFVTGLVTIVFAFRKRSLLIMVVQLGFIALVTSQALWVTFSLGASNDVLHYVGYARFYTDDALLAALLFFFFQLCLFAISILIPRLKESCGDEIGRLDQPPFPADSRYINKWFERSCFSFVVLLICPLIIVNAGGPRDFFLNPGSLITGQTALILSLGIVKWGLLGRVFYNMPIDKFSVFFFAVYVVFCLFTSRFLTVFALLQLALFWHYRISPLRWRSLAVALVGVFFVVVVFGVYRDIAHRSSGEIGDLRQFYSEVVKFLPLFFDWFFANNTEVFSGTCDAIRYLGQGGRLELLIPELNAVFSVIPGFIRTDDSFFISTLIKEVESVDSSSSVVTSGFERYVLGLGVVGFFIYSMGFCWYLLITEQSLRRPRLSFLVASSVHILSGIRGGLPGVLFFFGGAELLSSLCFRMFIARRDTSSRR